LIRRIIPLSSFVDIAGQGFNAPVVLLLHPADLLFDFGLFAALLSGAALLMVVLASRSKRKMRGRLPPVEGSNRAQRRKVAAETRRGRS